VIVLMLHTLGERAHCRATLAFIVERCCRFALHFLVVASGGAGDTPAANVATPDLTPTADEELQQDKSPGATLQSLAVA